MNLGNPRNTWPRVGSNPPGGGGDFDFGFSPFGLAGRPGMDLNLDGSELLKDLSEGQKLDALGIGSFSKWMNGIANLGGMGAGIGKMVMDFWAQDQMMNIQRDYMAHNRELQDKWMGLQPQLLEIQYRIETGKHQLARDLAETSAEVEIAKSRHQKEAAVEIRETDARYGYLSGNIYNQGRPLFG